MRKWRSAVATIGCPPSQRRLTGVVSDVSPKRTLMLKLSERSLARARASAGARGSFHQTEALLCCELFSAGGATSRRHCTAYRIHLGACLTALSVGLQHLLKRIGLFLIGYTLMGAACCD